MYFQATKIKFYLLKQIYLFAKAFAKMFQAHIL